MDASNAPNPTNPNAQDQNVDAVQGPANQAQGPMVPKSGSGPCRSNSCSDSNSSGTSSRSYAQPVPIQPAPVGMVVPTPQIIYQNWIGKKPEFSGKPEEDAESHLLSTRDWMEAHNFLEGEKFRHFCIMLMGEARLWFELLPMLDD